MSETKNRAIEWSMAMDDPTGRNQRYGNHFLFLFLFICGLSVIPIEAQNNTVEKTETATSSNDLGSTDEQVVENSLGMKLVLIPAGSFQMGSPPAERWHNPSETLHEVTISKPFYIGAYHVTQKQYEALMGNNPSSEQGANHPVNRISWEKAVEFCQWLSEVPEERNVGHQYRLATEAEWEYACRAGSQSSFHFGEKPEDLREYAWYTFNSQGKLHAVGGKKPNTWGLYDTYGNAWEWCHDWFADLGSEAVTDPTGPEAGEGRVIRGGCNLCFPMNLRSASRQKSDPTKGSSLIGFRVVMTIDER